MPVVSAIAASQKCLRRRPNLNLPRLRARRVLDPCETPAVDALHPAYRGTYLCSVNAFIRFHQLRNPAEMGWLDVVPHSVQRATPPMKKTRQCRASSLLPAKKPSGISSTLTWPARAARPRRASRPPCPPCRRPASARTAKRRQTQRSRWRSSTLKGSPERMESDGRRAGHASAPAELALPGR